MTALLTLEEAELDDIVTAPRYQAAAGESVLPPPLIAGERITVADLLRGLLVVSANDAAVALADHVAGSVPSFVRMMNRRAQQLGLENTHYANPIGLDDPGNYSTARDLAALTRALRKFRFFRTTVRSRTVTLESGARTRFLRNRNTLLTQHGWVTGVKTGFTRAAGNVLVASGRRKRGVKLISVVIGASTADERNGESVNLLNYGFTQYVRRTALRKGRPYGSGVPVTNRPGAVLPVVAGRTVRQVVRKNEDFQIEVQVPDEVAGPISSGDRIGTAVVRLDGEPIDTVPLNAALDIPQASGARQVQDVLTQPWILVVFGVILVVVALLTQRRTARPREELA